MDSLPIFSNPCIIQQANLHLPIIFKNFKKKFAIPKIILYLHSKININQQKNNEAMFKFTQLSAVGLPLLAVRLRGMVLS